MEKTFKEGFEAAWILLVKRNSARSILPAEEQVRLDSCPFLRQCAGCEVWKCDFRGGREVARCDGGDISQQAQC